MGDDELFFEADGLGPSVADVAAAVKSRKQSMNELKELIEGVGGVKLIDIELPPSRGDDLPALRPGSDGGDTNDVPDSPAHVRLPRQEQPANAKNMFSLDEIQHDMEHAAEDADCLTLYDSSVHHLQHTVIHSNGHLGHHGHRELDKTLQIAPTTVVRERYMSIGLGEIHGKAQKVIPSPPASLTPAECLRRRSDFVKSPEIAPVEEAPRMKRAVSTLCLAAYDQEDEQPSSRAPEPSPAAVQPPKRTMLEDFEILKVLGRGSFAKVLLVRKRDTKELYAMKCGAPLPRTRAQPRLSPAQGDPQGRRRQVAADQGYGDGAGDPERRAAPVHREAALRLPDEREAVPHPRLSRRRRALLPPQAGEILPGARRPVLRGGDLPRAGPSPQARHRLPRPQARERPPRRRGPRAPHGLRTGEGGRRGERGHADLLRDPRIHGALRPHPAGVRQEHRLVVLRLPRLRDAHGLPAVRAEDARRGAGGHFARGAALPGVPLRGGQVALPRAASEGAREAARQRPRRRVRHHDAPVLRQRGLAGPHPERAGDSVPAGHAPVRRRDVHVRQRVHGDAADGLAGAQPLGLCGRALPGVQLREGEPDRAGGADAGGAGGPRRRRLLVLLISGRPAAFLYSRPLID